MNTTTLRERHKNAMNNFRSNDGGIWMFTEESDNASFLFFVEELQEVIDMAEKMYRMKESVVGVTIESMEEIRIEDLKQNGKSQFDCDLGYNQALSDIITKLQERL